MKALRRNLENMVLGSPRGTHGKFGLSTPDQLWRLLKP